MPKISQCATCLLNAHSPMLVCAVHPLEVESDTCLDYRPRTEKPQPTEKWTPPGSCFWDGELRWEYAEPISDEERLWFLDEHPAFTGKYPECGWEFPKDNSPHVHWDCEKCGWVDDAVH